MLRFGVSIRAEQVVEFKRLDLDYFNPESECAGLGPHLRQHLPVYRNCKISQLHK